MSGGTSTFVILKGNSSLSCTGTMDQDLPCVRRTGLKFVNTAAAAQVSDQGRPALYHAALPGLFLFPAYRAAGGDRS